MADEQQRAAPDVAVLLAAADDVGLDPEGGPERVERRVGDAELLVRGRRQRERVVGGEDRRAGLEVEDERAGLRGRDVRHLQRLRELPGQRRAAGPGRGSEQERGQRDDGETAAHRHHCSEHRPERQVWAERSPRMGRAALAARAGTTR